MNDSIKYYDKNAKAFVDGTQGVDFSDTQNRFLKFLPAKSRILDFGCGSGRDTKFFLQQGYAVDATDGSDEMCELASNYTGIVVKKLFFSELSEINKYDGIWACASILHLPKEDLFAVLEKMMKATKNQGYIYVSFKYGDFEGYRNDRYFTDFTEKSFEDFIRPITNLVKIDEWITSDVRPGRSNEKWLNVILQKSNMI